MNAGRTAVGGLAAALLFGGIAYAISRPADRGRTASDRASAAHAARATKRLPAPRLTQHPEPQTMSTEATFRLADRARGVSLRCRLDDRAWASCGRQVSYASLALGAHRFDARAVGRRRRPSRVTGFNWTVEPSTTAPPAEELPFAITQTSSPPPLYPGAPPVSLPVTLDNPNPDPIFVTSLTVAVSGGPPGCGSQNIAVAPAGASEADPIEVPPGGSVSLPGAGSPATIQLLDLPVNQDACRGGTLSLSFNGSAHG